MNWKLIFQLSLFGLVMSVATVYIIPPSVEPFVWLVIFLLCAWILARTLPGRHFVHGLMVSILNSVWITTAHIVLFDDYVESHASEAQGLQSLPFSPQVMMAITGPIIGVVSGCVLGLFAYLGAKFVGQPAGQRS